MINFIKTLIYLHFKKFIKRDSILFLIDEMYFFKVSDVSKWEHKYLLIVYDFIVFIYFAYMISHKRFSYSQYFDLNHSNLLHF